MATKNFRSTVLEPTSEFAYGDKLRFTALATVGEVLKGSFSETTIVEDGVYSVDLQYGKHRIDYKPYEGVWRHFADVEVNADTLATSLQDLALASVPVTDETVLVLQGILADAEAAKAESAASAAAAAADAAKLADVTPESIGAVPVAGSVVLKPENALVYNTAFNGSVNAIKFSMPTSIYRASIRIQISSSNPQLNGMLMINLGYTSAGGYIFGLAKSDANSEYIVDFCVDSSGMGYLIIRSSLHVLSVITAAVVDYINLGGLDVYSEWSAETIDISAINSSEIKLTSSTASTMSEMGIAQIDHKGVSYIVDSGSASEIGISSADFDAALAEQRAGDLFKSEKSIALQIFADFNLGTGEQEITGSDISDVRAYIQSIDPAKGLKAGHLQRAKIPRPSIFDRYS